MIATLRPLAIAVLCLILPYGTTDDIAAAAAKVAATSAVQGLVYCSPCPSMC